MLIVAALKDEVKTFLAKMLVDVKLHIKPATLYQGEFEKKPVNLLITGIGKERAEKGLLEVFNYIKPQFILHVGYSGGASPVVSVGTLIVANRVIALRKGTSFKPSEDLFEKAKKVCQDHQVKFQSGGIATVDRIISSPHEKADIGVTCSSLALDMESVWIAKIATEKKIPWLVAKAILDPVEMEVPDLSDCVNSTGDADPIGALQHLVKKPKDIKGMTQMRTNAMQARETITDFLKGWLNG